MFGQGFNSPQLHQRFEPRLKAIQKTGSTAQVPLPFSLARPLPRSPLRSADGHRNRDAIVPRYLHISPSPIGNRYSVADSVRSLQLPSAPPKETKIESVGFGFFFCRPGSLIARKKMIAFRKNSNARGSENASNKSRLMLHSSLRFIFAQAKAPVVSTISPCRLFDGAFCFFAI